MQKNQTFFKRKKEWKKERVQPDIKICYETVLKPYKIGTNVDQLIKIPTMCHSQKYMD